MHRNALGSSGFTLVGGLIMASGAAIYMLDNLYAQRNWHLFRTPALIVMTIGVLLAGIGAFRGRPLPA